MGGYGRGWNDDASEVPAQAGVKRGCDESWEYGNDAKRAKLGEYGESSQDIGSGTGESGLDDERKGHTLGTMLRYMGIAPDTLGWDEEEGDFVDV